ncbi:MAG TPA: PadR family transcriptional regulator [Anaerolineaceae bacterium]|nr:PadR family transcriptional regulator [Anaerolineaceae bacterium]
MPSGRVPSLSFEFVILALLVPGPKHGYDIYKEMEAWTGLDEVWKLKQSMLYAEINKLEKLGFIASSPPDLQFSPPRVNHVITSEGRIALDVWLATPVERPREIRPEFLTKLLVAARFGCECTQNLLDLQKAKVQQWLNVENSQTTPSKAQQPELGMILSFRGHWLRHVSEWLDECQAMVDEAK